MAIPDSLAVFKLACSYDLGYEEPARSVVNLSVRDLYDRDRRSYLVYQAGQDKDRRPKEPDALDSDSNRYVREIILPAASEIPARLFRLAPPVLAQMPPTALLGLAVDLEISPPRNGRRAVRVRGRVLVDGREYANWGNPFPLITRRYEGRDDLGNRSLEAVLADQHLTGPLLPAALDELFVEMPTLAVD